MKQAIFLVFCSVVCSVQANDFPTLERVKFVNECMAINGGQSYQNMYSCSCKLDFLASELSFREYELADAFNRMRNMRGERGGYFRSSKQSRATRAKLKEVLDKGDKLCFVKQIHASSEE